jgi:L-amino acid N-acyltransferase YncA
MRATPGAPSLTLRPADRADFARVAEIYAHHVRVGLGTFDEAPPGEAEMLERHRQVIELDLPYLVASENAAVVGYAYAAPYRQRSAYRFTVEDSVYVAPEAQRRGAATALLRAVIAGCASAGMRQLVAVIGDSGNAASIALHEKCGFRRVGVLRDVGFKAGRWVDTVIMQRGL